MQFPVYLEQHIRSHVDPGQCGYQLNLESVPIRTGSFFLCREGRSLSIYTVAFPCILLVSCGSKLTFFISREMSAVCMSCYFFLYKSAVGCILIYIICVLLCTNFLYTGQIRCILSSYHKFPILYNVTRIAAFLFTVFLIRDRFCICDTLHI